MGRKNRAAGRKRGIRANVCFEWLEARQLLSAAHDIVGLTALRADPIYAGITGKNVTIALLDTGVYANNPDLRGNFLGYVDAVNAPKNSNGQFVAQFDSNPADAVDPNGHGSHTAGIAASTNPEIGAATGAKFVEVRVFNDQGSPVGSQSGNDPIVTGLQWVLANWQTYSIHVVNMSIGAPNHFNVEQSRAQQDQDAEARVIHALEDQGVSVVVSSGNDYAEWADGTANELGVSSPAIYSKITVGSTWPDSGSAGPGGVAGADWYAVDNDASPDQLSAFSQRSTLTSQVFAPGSDIFSTWNGKSSNTGSGLYNIDSGTSMAAPLVSGVIALMEDAAVTYGGKYLGPDQVISILKNTADNITDSPTSTNGRVSATAWGQLQYELFGTEQDLPETGLTYKRVNVYRAVQAVRALFVTTVDPTASVANAIDLASLNGTAADNIKGNIGYDGNVNVGANDVDLYRVEIDSLGQLTVTLTRVGGGVNFDSFLRVFDANGNQIGAADDNGDDVYPALQSSADNPLDPGTYYIGVSSYDNSDYLFGQPGSGGESRGDYQLNVTLVNPDPNGVEEGATPVDLLNPDQWFQDNNGSYIGYIEQSGTLGSDPPVPGSLNTNRISVPNGDVDMFKLVAPDNGYLTVGTNTSTYGSQAADTYLRVFQDDGNGNLIQIAADDDSGDGTDSLVTFDATAGTTYYVGVTNYGNRGFDQNDPYIQTSIPGYGRLIGSTATPSSYDVYFYFDNGDIDGTVYTATSETIGKAWSGDIGADGGIGLRDTSGGFDFTKDVDFVQLTAPSDGLLDVAVATDGIIPVLGLWSYDPNQDNVIEVADTGGNSNELIYPVTAGQVLYASITGYGNQDFNWFMSASGTGTDQTGTYGAAANLLPSSDAQQLMDNSVDGGTPQAISPGGTKSDVLGYDHGDYVTGADDVDLYSFTASVTGTITISTATGFETSADTVLRAFDAGGNELAWNDDASASTLGSQIVLHVTRGQTYYIGVSGAGPNARSYDPITGAAAGAGSTGDYTISLSQITPDDTTPPTASPTPTDGTLVHMSTNLGPIDIQLTDNATPLTVANFLNYVNSGAYDGTIIHRSIPGFVIQGGGYDTSGSHIQVNSPVRNEFQLSNVRGTIAMAKLGGDPNSATSEWFINLADNSQNLDPQNGGFTVFGYVLDMSTADAIAQLPTFSVANTPFSDLPLVNYAGTSNNPIPIEPDNLITVNKVVSFANFSVVAGGSSLLIPVTYSDNDLIDASTIGNNDLIVTGPNGYSQGATLVSTGLSNGSTIVAVYSIPAPGGTWDGNDNGSYQVSLQSNSVQDVSGNALAAGILKTLSVNFDVTPPTATLSPVTAPALHESETTITVTYSDNVAVDSSTIGSGDVVVTGPNNFSASASLISSNVVNGSIIATYSIAAPGGSWEPTANGTYSIAIQSAAVLDTSGNAVAAGQIGTFTVNLDGTAPTATLSSSTLPALGAGSMSFTVTYSDNAAIDPSTVGAGDVVVTGPSNFSAAATLFSKTVTGGNVVATYSITAPGGSLTPSANGTYQVSILANAVADESGNSVGAGVLGNFTVALTQSPFITTVNAATVFAGSSQTIPIQTTGYPTPALSESGALPEGVMLVDNHDGTASLSGTPTAGAGGEYAFTVIATNGVGSPTTQEFTLTVNEAPSISSSNSANFTVGTAGSFTITTAGYPIAAIMQSGALPAGLALVDNHDGTATLSGTPSDGSDADYSITLTAHNGASADATQVFTLHVAKESNIITQSGAPSLVFSTEPGNLMAGGKIPAFAILTEDANGNVSSAKSKVFISIFSGPAGAKLIGTSSVATKNGSAIFSKISIRTAGTYTLQATSSGNFAASESESFVVSAGSAKKMVITQQPGNVGVGGGFNLGLELLDSYGNLATNDNSVVTLALGSHPKNSVLAGATSAVFSDGMAEFDGLSLSAAGNYTIKLSDGKLKAATKKFTVS